MAKKPRTYGWTLKISRRELSALSEPARYGLLCGQQLARNAKRRSLEALDGQPPPKLTSQAIAAEDGTSPPRIYTALKQARIELFGKNLSDSATYNRVRQHEKLGTRHCNEPGCTTQLPPYAHASLRYCTWHGSNHARTSRHRRNQNGNHKPQ
jgi:hypothetical protein